MLSKIIEFVKEHKMLFGVGAIGAGLGYLFVSSAAESSKLPPPKLPGTHGVTPIPGGGLHVATGGMQGGIVVPPPAAVQTGNALFVTTKDPAPYGNLNVHATADVGSATIGYYPKDGAVEVISGPENGMLHVKGPGVRDGSPTQLEGWASADYLKSASQNPALAGLGILHDLGLV